MITLVPTYRDVDQAWAATMQSLLDLVDQDEIDRGIKQPSRDGDVVAEVHGWQFAIEAHEGRTFLRNPVRGMDPAYCAAEVLWCASGTDWTEPLLPYAPSYQERYGEPNGTAWGAYGARLRGQWDWTLKMLRDQPDGRQCVMQVFRDYDLYHGPAKRDIPCLTQFQFLRRDGRLHMSAVMRSQDAWLGMPCDVFAFTCLQRLVAAEVGLQVGAYVHCVPGSTHLYARYLERTREAVQWRGYKLPPAPNSWRLDDTLDSARTGFELIETLRLGKQSMAADEVLKLEPLGTMCSDLVNACLQKIRPGSALAPSWSRLRRSYPSISPKQGE